jgi:DNA-binding NarL/FixJ family response regulator
MTKSEQPTETKYKILIVDDHPLVREGLASRITRQPDMEICGEAADVNEALALVKTTNPDLVIVDLSLRLSHGTDLIKQVKARGEGTKMLVSSMYDESLYAERVLRAGAMGYINKQEMPEKVIEAIRQVLAGKVYLSPSMTDRLLSRAIGKTGEIERSPIEKLSNRELEIFRLIGRGLTTRQIAKDLHLSVKTVETHRENIKSKLSVSNSAELSRQAVQWVLENG